ncbi:MAG: hypothetical protein ORN28_03935, partial [Rhodoferax sp.]|nr:hypothetical protein [Rhodoferax sp.]
MFTVFLDNGGNVIVSDITKDLNTFDVNPVPDVSSQYAYIITPRYITETVNGVNFPQFAGGSTLNGILSTPPYSISPSLDAKRVWYTGNAGSKPAVPTGGVVNPVDGSIVVAPDLWSLTPQPSIQAGQLRYYSVLISSIGATNKWSDVYTDCVIDRNKLDYPDDNQRQAYYIKASITNNIITWGSPTAWFNGVYYADNIAVHDGRIVLVDKDNNFLYFGISKNTFKYFGIDSSSTMIEYPVGSFVNTSSTIAEVVSSTLSGITSQLSLNFFVLMVSGELLSFTGNYPSIDSSIWGAGGVVQIPSSLSNTQSFVRAQADIHYVSSQGIISLFNSIRAGQYEVLNDKLQTRFNSIARSGANVKVSSVFAWRQNVILHQVDDTTYVYNLISKSWSTWKISNYGYFYYYSGNLYCLSLNGLTLSKYNTSTFLDDAYYLPNQSTDGGFNGVVFGIKNTIPG